MESREGEEEEAKGVTVSSAEGSYDLVPSASRTVELLPQIHVPRTEDVPTGGHSSVAQ